MIKNTADGLRINGLFFRGCLAVFFLIIVRQGFWIRSLKNSNFSFPPNKPSYIVRNYEIPIAQTIQGFTTDLMEYCRKQNGKYIGDDKVIYCIFDNKILQSKPTE